MSDDHIIPLDPNDPADLRIINQQDKAEIARLREDLQLAIHKADSATGDAEARGDLIDEHEGEIARLREQVEELEAEVETMRVRFDNLAGRAMDVATGLRDMCDGKVPKCWKSEQEMNPDAPSH